MYYFTTVNGYPSLLQAGGGGSTGDAENSISYLDLLKILSQHGLHIKESGLIGRHSKRVSILNLSPNNLFLNYHYRIIKTCN